eukprot:13724014-Alexandrium_andersonii.AAC.1
MASWSPRRSTPLEGEGLGAPIGQSFEGIPARGLTAQGVVHLSDATFSWPGPAKKKRRFNRCLLA